MTAETDTNDSKKPNNSTFHQQKLSGWQPLVTTNTLYIPFIIIGILFIIFGSVFIYYTYQIVELKIDYTNCKNAVGEECGISLTKYNLTYDFKSCKCVLNITVPEAMDGNTNVYYGLTQFYQNHRAYVSSRDDSQLRGKPVNNHLSEDCMPYQYYNSTSKIAYAPCGLIANSLFNDTFQLFYNNHSDELIEVPWTSKGIAWISETEVRYGKPTSWNNTIKPHNWPKTALERNKNTYSGDEELLVWLRTAAFPNFKKMHRRVIHNPNTEFSDGLPNGSYQLVINYSYPVTQYGGTKQFILSNANNLGGRNPSIGIILLALGAIYLSLSVAFIFINNFVNKRQLNEAWIIASQTAEATNIAQENDSDHFIDGDGGIGVSFPTTSNSHGRLRGIQNLLIDCDVDEAGDTFDVRRTSVSSDNNNQTQRSFTNISTIST